MGSSDGQESQVQRVHYPGQGGVHCNQLLPLGLPHHHDPPLYGGSISLPAHPEAPLVGPSLMRMALENLSSKLFRCYCRRRCLSLAPCECLCNVVMVICYYA